MSGTPVRADIMGIVMFLHCEEGAEVNQGEPLLSIECMKLFYEQTAPTKGQVHFECKLGDIVDEGQLLATIIPRGE